MAKFIVEAPHTGAECLAMLDEIAAEKPRLLGEFQWGCLSGVHTGWAELKAESEAAARDLLPESQRDNWSVTAVTPFTEEQIRALHKA